MKHFGRSLLNPTPASIPSTFAIEASSGEPTPFSSKRGDRNGDSIEGEFCLLGGNEQTFRKASANEGRA